jgi:LMBR1 domain-containing protein 1
VATAVAVSALAGPAASSANTPASEIAALRAQLIAVVDHEGTTELTAAESSDLIQEINTYTAAELMQLAEELDLGPSVDRVQEVQRAWITRRETSGSGSTPTTAPTTPTEPAAKQIAELGTALLVKAWIPFTVVAVISFFGAFFYVRYYQHKRERECGSTMAAIFAIAFSLMTLALLPVDIFLVSSQKLCGSEGVTCIDGVAAGAYELGEGAWSENQVSALGHLVQDAYYAMYALLMLFAFLLLPLAYFFYEEKDEEAGTSCGKRLFGAMKYTTGFLVFMGILMCIGAFASSSNVKSCPDSNTTTEAYAKCGGSFAEKALVANGGTNAISFTLGSLAVIGFLYFAFYTSAGMVTMPIKMIRSRGKASKDDRDTAAGELDASREQQDAIRSKYKNRKKKAKMTSRDRSKLLDFEERDRVVNRALTRVNEDEQGLCPKVTMCCKPFSFIFGIIFFLFSLFMAVSLLMTLADKLLQIVQQPNLDFQTGYTQVASAAFYPVDKMLTLAVGVFPVDYILISFIVYFFVICTMAGVKSLGVRFCHLRLYKIRPRRTVPQGILFFAFILMFTMIAMNHVLLALAPQYVKYGNQQAPNATTHFSHYNNETDGFGFVPVGEVTMEPCSDFVFPINTLSIGGKGYVLHSERPPNATTGRRPYSNGDWGPKNCATFLNGEASAALKELNLTFTDTEIAAAECHRNTHPCLKTQMVSLLQSFFFSFWFFGAIYYWSMWVFILIYFVSMVAYTCKNRKSIVQAMINDVQSDLDDSDDDMTEFKPSWGNSSA